MATKRTTKSWSRIMFEARCKRTGVKATILNNSGQVNYGNMVNHIYGIITTLLISIVLISSGCQAHSNDNCERFWVQQEHERSEIRDEAEAMVTNVLKQMHFLLNFVEFDVFNEANPVTKNNIISTATNKLMDIVTNREKPYEPIVLVIRQAILEHGGEMISDTLKVEDLAISTQEKLEDEEGLCTNLKERYEQTYRFIEYYNNCVGNYDESDVRYSKIAITYDASTDSRGVNILGLDPYTVILSGDKTIEREKVLTTLVLTKYSNQSESTAIAPTMSVDIKGFKGVNATTTSALGDIIVSPYYGEGYQYVITIKTDDSSQMFMKIREWCYNNNVAYKPNSTNIYVNCTAVLQ